MSVANNDNITATPANEQENTMSTITTNITNDTLEKENAVVNTTPEVSEAPVTSENSVTPTLTLEQENALKAINVFRQNVRNCISVTSKFKQLVETFIAEMHKHGANERAEELAVNLKNYIRDEMQFDEANDLVGVILVTTWTFKQKPFINKDFVDPLFLERLKAIEEEADRKRESDHTSQKAEKDKVKKEQKALTPRGQKIDEKVKIIAETSVNTQVESRQRAVARKKTVELLKQAINDLPQHTDRLNQIVSYVENVENTPQVNLSEIEKATKAIQENALDQVSSQVGATYSLTLQVFPTNERTAKRGGDHSRVMKVALVPGVAWRQGASFLVDQFNRWAKLPQNQHLNARPFEVKIDDFLFVQNKTDENGNESAIPDLNKVLTSLGYLAVTPGFWIKKDHPYADWIRSVFKTNLVVRGRARSIATTPYQAQLTFQIERGEGGAVTDVRNTPVFVADLTQYGHAGLDGSNIISKNLVGTGWVPGVVAQIRLHTNPYISTGMGLQGKGLVRPHRGWAVQESDGWVVKSDYDEQKAAIESLPDITAEDKATRLQNLKALYVPAIILHHDNVKGAGSKLVETQVKGTRKLLNLNTWGMPDGVESALFGGLIAEDYRGKSTTSWQNTQLYSPAVLNVNAEYLQSLIDKALGKLTVNDDGALATLPGMTTEVRQLISAQQASNQKWTTAVAFGANQKWSTFYCEQMEMPAGFVVAGGDIGKKAEKLVITGQPQLYHQCLVVARRLSWEDVRITLASLDGEAPDAFGHIHQDWLTAWGEMDPEISRDEIARRLRWMANGFIANGTESLLWVSTIDQKTMQRDSDGDRLLVLWDDGMIKLVEHHNSSIKSLPKPYLEVDKKTPLDGDDAYKALAGGDWGDLQTAEAANEYICAPNAGQGPTGILVNAASAALNHIMWVHINGKWQPEEDKMDVVLKLYGFLCLLIQCSIDRQKKVWAVPALRQWQKLDLYSGDVAVYEVLEPGVEKYKFFSRNSNSVIEMPVRNGYATMLNEGIIKWWVAMMINLINAKSTHLNDVTGSNLVTVLENVANSLKFMNDNSPEDWSLMTDPMGAQISPEELGQKWVWPDGLYSFKDEASLQVPVERSAPGIQWLTRKVTAGYAKWCADHEVSNYPTRQLFLKLSNSDVDWLTDNDKSTNTFGINGRALEFVTEFSNLMARATAQNLSSIANSEIKQGRGGDTAREALKDIRAALAQFDVYHPVSKLIKHAVGKDATAANVGIACMGLIRMWVKAWLSCAAGDNMIEFFSVLDVYGYMQNFDWTPEVEKEGAQTAEKELTLADAAKNILRKLKFDCTPENKQILQDMLADIRENKPLAQLVSSNCLAKQLYAESKTQEPSGIEKLLTEWLPALELAGDNVDQKEERRELFLADNIFQAFCHLIGSPEIVDERTFLEFANAQIMPVLAQKLIAVTKAEANKANANPNDGILLDWYRLVANRAGWDAGKLTGNLTGFAKLYMPHILPRMREIVDLMTPFVQAYRTKVWITQMYGKVGSLGTSDPQVHNDRLVEFVENAIFSVKMQFNQGTGNIEKVKQIKSRPEVAVSPALRAAFTYGLLNAGVSHYGLHTNLRPVFIENQDGSQKLIFSRSDRWVYLDSLMPLNKDMLEKACDQGVVYGHIFNPDWLQVMVNSLHQQLGMDGQSDEERNNRQAKLDVLNHTLSFLPVMYQVRDYGQRQGERQITGSLAFPAWYGGRDKSFAHTRFDSFRTSAHRSVWRFIMSVMPEDAPYEAKAGLYDHLTGCKTVGTSGRSGYKVEAKNDWAAALSGSSWSTSTATSGRQTAPRDMNTTPGHMMVNGNWQKPDRSPANEFLGMMDVMFENSDQFQMINHAYTQRDGTTNFVVHTSYKQGDNGWSDNTSKDFTNVLSLRRMAILSMRCDQLRGRINGLATNNLVAESLSRLNIADVPQCKVKSHEEFNKLLIEAIIGCWGATNALDSIVVSKMSEDDTWNRFKTKTSTAWRDFTKGDNKSFEIVAPNAQLFYNLLFAVKAVN